MKKNILLVLTLLLAGCSDNNQSDSIKESNSDYVTDLLINNSITVSVNEKVRFFDLITDDYSTSLIDYIFTSNSILTVDRQDNLIASKVGKDSITVVADDEYKQVLEVNVIENMVFTDEKLKGKNVCVFGDSISDNSVTAYEIKPKFWVETLEEKIGKTGTLYNFAKSGATVGYSVSMERTNALESVATNVVHETAVINGIKDSDLAIIFIGANDFWRQVTAGKDGDVNDKNYSNTESFIGSYSYLISKIKEANPNIEIVCFSTLCTTWNFDTCTNYSNRTNCFQSQELMNQGIKELALSKGCMFIDIYDLWDKNTISTYVGDGIHPITVGYELMIDRLFGKK